MVETPKNEIENTSVNGVLDMFKSMITTNKLNGLENSIIGDEKKADIEKKAVEGMNKIGNMFKMQIPFLGDLGTLFGKKRPIDLLGTKEERSKNKILNGILKILKFGSMEEIHIKYIENQLNGVDKEFAEECFKEYKKTENTNIDEDKSSRKICELEGICKNMTEEEKTNIKSKVPEDFNSLKESLIKELPKHINKLSLSTVNMVDSGLIITENNENKVNIKKIEENPENFIDKYLKLNIPLFVSSGEEFISSPNINSNTFAYALFGNLTGEKFFVEGVSLGLNIVKLPEIKDNDNEYSYEYIDSDISNFEGEVKKEMTNYRDIVNIVIEKIEGGYYNPSNMYTARMGKSGETMMGIDRKHGGSLNTSPAGKEFWRLIDEDKTKHPDARAKHGYKGGNLETKLRSLAGDIIKPHYENLCTKYLSDESIKTINADGRLMFNFIYGAWNGVGWFEKMANEINSKISAGIKDTDILTKDIVNWRIHKSGNSLIAQGGRKIEQMIDSA